MIPPCACIHRDRPKCFDGWKLAGFEGKPVVEFACVQDLSRGVAQVSGIDGFFCRIPVDASQGSKSTLLVLACHLFGGTKQAEGCGQLENVLVKLSLVGP